MTEFELKFEVPPASLKGVAAAMQPGKTTRQRLQARYFDTDDHALARSGLVLRLRKEGRHWVQTAKAQTADMLERLEHNAAFPSPPQGAVLAPDLARHRGTPVGAAIDKALRVGAKGDYPELHLLYETDINRVTSHVVFKGSVVELALDQGRVFSGADVRNNSTPKSQAIRELEFELKQGLPVDAVELAGQWCAHHGLWISTIAKSMKGQRLCSGNEFVAATPALPPSFSKHATARDMMTAVISACLNHVLPNMSELASGSTAPDQVHQLRVGIRRLRTALGERHELVDSAGVKASPAADWEFLERWERWEVWGIWEEALVSAFRALGAHRDASNLTLVTQPHLLAAGGPGMSLKDVTGDRADLGEIVRKPEFQNALLGLLRFVYQQDGELDNDANESDETNTSNAADTPTGLKKMVSRRLNKLHKQALLDGKKFLELNEEQQHRVRKRLKRLRYLIEFSAPLFVTRKTNKKIQRMSAALKPAQDALGLYNDELMALHAWQALVVDDPNAWFGVGWLTARQEPNARRCLKEIKAFANVKPFWRK